MSKLPEIITSSHKENKKIYRTILDKIVSYDRIAIFRHIRPDYDALGSQVGLATWIKDNFKDKDVKMLGDHHVIYTGRVYPEMDKISESWFSKPFLAIVVDCANTSRIADPRYKHAKEIIKIDHHPNTEDFGDISFVKDKVIACSEILADILLSYSKYTISKEAAIYFYTGIVGDSGRFKFKDTNSHTFAISSELVKTGFDLAQITQDMYTKPVKELEVTKFVLNNFKLTEKGVAYYILENKDLEALHIGVERGKENVKMFSEYDEIKIYCSITEDITEHIYRVSLRSKNIPVNEVAAKFEGGGHPLASGATLHHKSDIPKFIEELDKLIK